MEEIHSTHRFSTWLVAALTVAMGFLFSASSADAATLSFSPSSGTFRVGSTFNVNLIVGSTDQAMNAVEAQLHVSEDTLEILGISKIGSVTQLWVNDPSFSANSGIINLAGVVLNPGYTGGGAKVLSISLRPKAEGVGTIRFVSSQVLANDGVGTNILKSSSGATFTIQPRVALTEPVVPPVVKPVPPPVPVLEVVTPGETQLSSPSHPDPEKWYSANKVVLTWKLPKGVTSENYVLDHSPLTVPAPASHAVTTSASYDGVEDGVWYFHIRFQNEGGWGYTTSRKVQVDVTNPSYAAILRTQCGVTESWHTNFAFDAIDATSGIASYSVAIDDAPEAPWADDGSHVFVVPQLTVGSHKLSLRAFDGAGNSRTTSEVFSVGTVLAPVVTHYTSLVPYGSAFRVTGYTSPGAIVKLHILSSVGDITRLGQADLIGTFQFVEDGLRLGGDYTFWIETIDTQKNISASSAQLPFEVRLMPVLEQYFLQYPWRVIGALLFTLFLLVFVLARIIIIRRWMDSVRPKSAAKASPRSEKKK